MPNTLRNNTDTYIAKRTRARNFVSKAWFMLVGIMLAAILLASISGCSRYGEKPAVTVGSVKYKNCTIDKVDVPGARDYLYVGICGNTATVNQSFETHNDKGQTVDHWVRATVVNAEDSK